MSHNCYFETQPGTRRVRTIISCVSVHYPQTSIICFPQTGCWHFVQQGFTLVMKSITDICPSHILGVSSLTRGCSSLSLFELFRCLDRPPLAYMITPFFYKQSIFDPHPENCLSFSKKSPPKIV